MVGDETIEGTTKREGGTENTVMLQNYFADVPKAMGPDNVKEQACSTMPSVNEGAMKILLNVVKQAGAELCQAQLS